MPNSDLASTTMQIKETINAMKLHLPNKEAVILRNPTPTLNNEERAEESSKNAADAENLRTREPEQLMTNSKRKNIGFPLEIIRVDIP